MATRGDEDEQSKGGGGAGAGGGDEKVVGGQEEANPDSVAVKESVEVEKKEGCQPVKEEGGGGDGVEEERGGGDGVEVEGGSDGVEKKGGGDGVEEEGGGGDGVEKEGGGDGVEEEGGGGDGGERAAGSGGEGGKAGAVVTEEPSCLEGKVIRQVEFYFGDRNLPKDKFLLQAIASNEEGWIPIATLLTFNRLKALSSDAGYIAAALRKSSSAMLEVSTDGERVRRCPDKPAPATLFDPDLRREIRNKSIYAKGFPEDCSLDDLQTFFDQFGKVDFVQMRRRVTGERKLFKGSVFVEFHTLEDAVAFLARADVKFGGAQLLTESKEAYFKRKTEERKVARDKKRQEESQRQEDVREKQSKAKVAGAVLHFKGCGPKASFEEIKEVFQEFASVGYVEFSRGDSEGYVRFLEEGGAQKAVSGLKATAGAGEGEKPELCGGECDVRVVEGEEEEEYWGRVAESRLKKLAPRRGAWRGGGHGHKRRQWGSGDGPAPKQARSEQ